MYVKVRYSGLIRHYVGKSEEIFELPEGARFGDLLLEVGREYGSCMPDHMWDAEEERFHPTIVAARKGSRAESEDDNLKPGDEIYVFSRMAGG